MATSHGTATDISPNNDDVGNELFDLIEDFDIDPHIISLYFNEPFYAKILRGLTKTCTKEIPTAGVLAKDGDIKMWYNPGFMHSLTDLQTRGLLKHEAMHLALFHTTIRRLEPHNVHNYAADLAINSCIPEVELPEGGLFPGKEFEALSETQREKMSDEAQERYTRMSAFIADLPIGLSTEEYFARLMSDEQMREDIDGSKDDDGSPGQMDDHDGWDNMTDEEKDLITGKVKQAVKEAVKDCDNKGQWGSVPAAVQNEIRKLISNEIPWQAVLKKFVGFTKRSVRNTSWNKINKKSPMLMPGARKKNTASIAVYIDQSGSVSGDELELLFGELQSLAKYTEFTTFHFDCTVDEASETTWKKNRVQAPHRTRSGGTCFKSVQQHAIKNKHRFDGYLILTDGYAANPGISRMKRGWVITTEGDVQDWMGGKDFIIKMKTKAKDQ